MCSSAEVVAQLVREQVRARAGGNRDEAAADRAGIAARRRAVDQADEIDVDAPGARADRGLQRRLRWLGTRM